MTLAKPMFAASYPIAFNALKANSVKSHLSLVSSTIEAALAADEIISTDFAYVKQRCNSFVEDSFRAAISNVYLYCGKYTAQPQDLQNLDMPYEVRSLKSLAKKLDKVSKESKDSQMYKDTKALIDELMNLYDVMEYLKVCSIKVSDKKAQLKELVEAEKEEYNKKFTNHKDVKKVIDLLKLAAVNIEQQVYETRLKSLQAIVDAYKEQCAAGNSDYSTIYKNNPFYAIVIQGLVERIQTGGYSKIKNFSLVTDWKAKIENMAKRTASDIIDHFVYKNAGKLSYIIYTKNNMLNVRIENVHTNSGAVECDLVVNFDDGSKFTAKSSVVLAYSKFGKLFYRYPTVFRNVLLPNGNALTGVSEQKMDEVFAIAK